MGKDIDDDDSANSKSTLKDKRQNGTGCPKMKFLNQCFIDDKWS